MSDIYVKLLGIAKCFRDFDLEDLKRLLAISSKAVWKAGEDIFVEGDSGSDMFVICAGKVHILRNSAGVELELASLGVGDSFGEMGLINGGTRSAGARSVEDTIALRIGHEGLHKAPRAALLLYRNIARELAERLKSANDVIVFQSQSFGELPPLDKRGR